MGRIVTQRQRYLAKYYLKKLTLKTTVHNSTRKIAIVKYCVV